MKFCFIAIHSSVFRRVRGLVGEIEYAFEYVYTYTQKFVSNPFLGSNVVQPVDASILTLPKHRKFSQVPTADIV